MASNLFNKAKKSAPVKSSKAKDEKVRLRIKDSDFFDKVQSLEELQERMKSDKAKADIISDEIKEVGKIEWSREYDRSGKNPGSVMLESRSGVDIAQTMFVPSDKYISINEERANHLIETFGEDSVEETTSFSFDSEMVNKYGEIISMLIEQCEDIREEDKERIIKANTSYSVSKGTIDKLKDYSKNSSMEIEDIIEEVKPVISLKNVEVIKG